MKNQEYIQSGILESYLLGLVSEEEQKEVEQKILVDSEISEALQALEMNIANYYTKNAVPPPTVVRDAILLNAQKTELDKWTYQQHSSKQQTTQAEQAKYLEVEVNDTHIKVHKYWRPAFIAVFILSKVFLIAALYLYFKADSLTKENERLKQEIKLK
ncbi:hypothetical protein [Arcicella lustrica]|uniref:Anti-sigma factor n=1 Tax=Arcicella lustrica TaxID=2984196 RepID=A0ABU5SIK1_9BACT|nr:hypothetical protein [Arcicella sp. DC25W]MEA5427120.1 hypothetical protein [Arcicella sp. DC25W]